MRTDFVVYGPSHWYYRNYFYQETELAYGFDLNDSDDKMAFGFQMGKDAVISSYGMYIINIVGDCPSYLTGMTTLTGTAGDWDSGYPSDDLYNNAAWEDYDPTALGSGWSWVDFETPVNVNRGDFVCLQVKPGTNPPNNVDFVEINTESTLRTQNPGHWVYNTYWYRYEWIGPAAIKFTDATILGWPIVQPVWEEFNSPAEWGLEFKIPLQAKCIGGVLSILSYTDDHVPFELILADSNDTELASLSVTLDDVGHPYGDSYIYVTWNSATDPILAADTTYRLYLKPLTSNVLTKHGFIFADEESKQVMPGGTDWKMIERSTPVSGWSYVENGYPWISLLLTDFQVGSGDASEDGGAFGFIG